MPKGYQPEKKVNRFQDEIEEVTEIYFTNKGTESISINNVFLQVNFLKLEISPSKITVEPGNWVISDPIVEITSIYRPDIESVLHYEYEGKKYEAALPQIRTPVSELKRKQTSNSSLQPKIGAYAATGSR